MFYYNKHILIFVYLRIYKFFVCVFFLQFITFLPNTVYWIESGTADALHLANKLSALRNSLLDLFIYSIVAIVI